MMILAISTDMDMFVRSHNHLKNVLVRKFIVIFKRRHNFIKTDYRYCGN